MNSENIGLTDSRSETLSTYIKQFCNKFIINKSIKFPFILGTDSPISYYIVKDGSNSEVVKNMVQGMIFSFVSAVGVSRIVLNVVDCDSHGSNMDSFFEIKRKLPNY